MKENSQSDLSAVDSKPDRKVILAPWYFEMLSVRLTESARNVSCMPILFLIELSKHGYEWVRGVDICNGISTILDSRSYSVAKYEADMDCFDVERRQGLNGSSHYYFRLKSKVQLVDSQKINGKLMNTIFNILLKINIARPKQTPRIGLLLYAIFGRKLVDRYQIDEYLENQAANSSHIIRQINLLIEMKFVSEQKKKCSKNSTHYIIPFNFN